jgi:HAMP domain-containing protein
MESLQRETDALLDPSASQARTQRLDRLRRFRSRDDGQQAEGAGVVPVRRGERLLNGFEQEVTRRLRVLLQRLDVPTRDEIEALASRIGVLEDRIRRLGAERQRRSESSKRKRVAQA